MKVFRYIFIIIVIGLIAFSAYSIYSENNKDETEGNIEIETAEKQVITNLRLGISKFDTMNPLISTNKSIQYIDKLIFESLLVVNEDYSLSNCLAKEYSRIGAKSFLIKIRDDVIWHDGVALTAKDVQFTIDRLKDGKILSIYQENVKDIIGVEIIDEYTIKVNLDKEVPFFEYNLIFPILPNHYYLDEDFGQSTKIPIGTGMYKIRKIESSFIEIGKNEEWWNKEKNTKLDKITLNLYTSMGEIYNAFKIGNIDRVCTNNENYNQYIGTIGFDVNNYYGREYDFLSINMNNNILKRKEVRQAIASCIDKNNIIATIFNNNYDISNYPLDYGHYLYSNEIGTIEYNPEVARKVLEENGWTLSSRTWSKIENYRTIRTSFSLIVNSSNIKRVAVAESIKNQLADAGIEINVKQVSDSQYKSYLDNKNYELILTGINISLSPNLDIFFGINNLANFSNQEVYKIINSVNSMNDKKMLKEYYKQLQQIYQDEIPYISLYRNREYFIHSPYLVGELKPTWYNIYYNIENWYRQN